MWISFTFLTQKDNYITVFDFLCQKWSLSSSQCFLNVILIYDSISQICQLNHVMSYCGQWAWMCVIYQRLGVGSRRTTSKHSQIHSNRTFDKEHTLCATNLPLDCRTLVRASIWQSKSMVPSVRDPQGWDFLEYLSSISPSCLQIVGPYPINVSLL